MGTNPVYLLWHLVGCVLLAAIGKIFLSASRAEALPVRLLIFVALMLALLKYNQQVMSAVNAPAELIGFPGSCPVF